MGKGEGKGNCGDGVNKHDKDNWIENEREGERESERERKREKVRDRV